MGITINREGLSDGQRQVLAQYESARVNEDYWTTIVAQEMRRYGESANASMVVHWADLAVKYKKDVEKLVPSWQARISGDRT